MRPLATAAAATCALWACDAATAIVVDVSTDLPCSGASPMTTTIAVGDSTSSLDERPAVAATTRCDPATGHIGTLVVVPSGANDEPVAIRVVTAIDRSPDACLTSPSGCIVARRALRFVPHETIQLPILMGGQCDGVACMQDETCQAAACVPAGQVGNPQDASPPSEESGADAAAPPSPDAEIDASQDAGAPPSCAPDCMNGAACASDMQCASKHCHAGTCQAPGCAPLCNDGESCGSPSDCASRICVADRCQPPACAPACPATSACGNDHDCSSGHCHQGACM